MRQLDLRRIPKDVLEELQRIVTPDKDGRLDWKSLTVFTARHWKSFLVVGGIMAVVSYLVVKSGLAASVLNKMRRQRFAGVEIDPPPPGTPLLEALGPRGMLEHSGLYLGNSAAAELHGDGVFKRVTLSRFLNGDDDDPDNSRCGTKIFAACDLETKRPLALDAAVDFALERIDETTEYNLLTNNCHLFTASCLLGRLLEPLALSDLFIHGAYSIAKLEDVISEKVNGGRDICWLSVRRCAPAFDFFVSQEKIGADGAAVGSRDM